MSDLVPRIKTVAVLLPLLIISFCYLPKSFLLALLILVWFAACYELLQPFGLSKATNLTLLLLNTVFVALNTNYIMAHYVGLFCIIIAVLVMLRCQNTHKFILLGLSLYCIDCLMFSMLHIYDVAGLVGIAFIWAMVATVDAAGYFFGRAFGKHQLMPKVSPKKTWEGVAGALLLVTIFTLIVISNQYWLVYLGFILGVVSCCVMGDLWFSYVKRSLAIKDFSNILPGHGGLLDRLDGLIFVIIPAAVVSKIFAKLVFVG